MPNCFTLTRKGETEPASLCAVDEVICEHLGVPADPKRYRAGWYDSIGFLLACGKTFDQIRDIPLVGEEIEKIRKFLAANYDVDCWTEIGRR